ncbi:hypothetical protein [Actinoplanes flavus]|uniref:Uncharacterized protein n=1 Tax=Actinoplanes flavus TaxID=2820290 RepID=A0ABS3UCR1_9ACTN|nr:hypothetical protein [Actinoplanes flavus]MBO3736579.1 hypothetical protein [Actinoplanes flavus]
MLITAIAWLLSHQLPMVAVQRCMAPDRRLAWLGIHLALLREHAECAAGQMALDVSPGRIAGIVVLVAVPQLLGNLFTLAGAAGLWAMLRVVLAGAAAALGRLSPRLHVHVIAAAGSCRPVLDPAWGLSLRPWQLDRSPVRRRGPPLPSPL